MTAANLDTLSKQTGVPLWMLKVVQDVESPKITVHSFKAGMLLLSIERSRCERLHILHQLVALVTTLKEAKLISMESRKFGEKLMGAALRRWNQVGEAAVHNSTSFLETSNLVRDLPPRSQSKKLAVEKCFTLASSFTEAKFVFHNSMSETALSHEALKAMIEYANTMNEAKEAYNSCHLGDPLQIKAMRKWTSLSRQALSEANSTEAIRALTKLIPHDGEAMEFAAKRALQIADA